MVDEAQNVPRWFSEFAVKNADEHGLLAARIEASYGELREEIARAESRSTRWTAGIVLGAITVGVGVLSTIIILVN